MKTGMGALLIALCFMACTQQAKTENTETETYNRVGVENVNGSMPDTTNSIDLSTHNDSTHQE